jgi:hypothetical protein
MLIPKPLWARFVLSLIVAFAAFAASLKGEFRGIFASDFFVYAGAVLILIWIGLVIEALYRFRYSGLILLLGAPIALGWPFLIMLLIISCLGGGGCL